jgi:hypothetical protein
MWRLCPSIIEEQTVEKQRYAVGDRVNKLCEVCGEERGHIVALVNKHGRITRVTCPQCSTRSACKSRDLVAGEQVATRQEGTPYDWTRTYRKGQRLLHPTFGLGEVTALVEPKKIDVLFEDRVRRLVHGRAGLGQLQTAESRS